MITTVNLELTELSINVDIAIIPGEDEKLWEIFFKR